MSKFSILLFAALAIFASCCLSSLALANSQSSIVPLKKESPFGESVKHRGMHCQVKGHFLNKACPHKLRYPNGESDSIAIECGGLPFKKSLSFFDINKLFFGFFGEIHGLSTGFVEVIFINSGLTSVYLANSPPPPKSIL